MITKIDIPKDITKITKVSVWTSSGWKSQEVDIQFFANSYRENIANKILRLLWYLYLSD